MKFSKLLISAAGAGVLTLGYAGAANAIPSDGFEDESIAGSVRTLTFDTCTNATSPACDILGSGQGIEFNYGGGLVLTVTNPNYGVGNIGGEVIQDWPADGGLGVNGGPGGDNLARRNMSNEEALKFTFNMPVNLLAAAFNGGHVDTPQGGIKIIGGGPELNVNGTPGFIDLSARNLMGTMFTFRAERAGGNNFSGYVEALQVSVKDVPEPATLAILGIGLMGLGFAYRRRRQDV